MNAQYQSVGMIARDSRWNYMYFRVLKLRVIPYREKCRRRTSWIQRAGWRDANLNKPSSRLLQKNIRGYSRAVCVNSLTSFWDSDGVMRRYCIGQFIIFVKLFFLAPVSGRVFWLVDEFMLVSAVGMLCRIWTCFSFCSSFREENYIYNN